MATIGEVWDSTTDVLAGRAREIAPFAIGALLVPAVSSAALGAYLAPASGSASGAIVSLAFAIVALWGRLAITAIALDPATDGIAARAQATRALPRLIGVLLVLGAAALVLLVPIVVVLTQAGFDWRQASATGTFRLPVLTGGAMWFARLYPLLLTALILWVAARVKLLATPVVLAEGRAIGAIGRAASLSQGMTWRLIGVVLLYYVMLWVSVLAVTWVAGSVLRLLLGADARATVAFLATVLGAIVGTAFDATAQVFAARLYAALAGRPAA